MPTKSQLYSIWEAEFNNPWTRRRDDPMYVSPERFAKNIADEEMQAKAEKEHRQNQNNLKPKIT